MRGVIYSQKGEQVRLCVLPTLPDSSETSFLHFEVSGSLNNFTEVAMLGECDGECIRETERSILQDSEINNELSEAIMEVLTAPPSPKPKPPTRAMVEELLPGLLVLWVSSLVAIGMNSASSALWSGVVFAGLLSWMYLEHPTDFCQEVGITVVMLSVIAGGLLSSLLWVSVLAFGPQATRTIGWWVFLLAFAQHLMWTIGWYNVKIPQK